MHTLHVDLGPRSYPIQIGNRILSALGPICRERGIPSTIVVITDKTVGKLYLPHVVGSLKHHGFTVHEIVIPPGEHQKTLKTANKIFTSLIEKRISRNSAIAALGGGVIGDLAGFIASTYLRGLPFIQLPTTLLAQADSSVGGKVAVNHPMGKNMVGAFYQPRFVLSDVEVLRTLPSREVVCGLGEVVKFAIISDPHLFDYIEQHLDELLALESDPIMTVITRCCEIKASLVSRDELEKGERIILNYGHTVGHALEAAGDYRALKHGEAVILGMWVENILALKRGWISEEVHDRLQRLLGRLIPLIPPPSMNKEDALSAMAIDKKTLNGKVRMVLPRRIGEVSVADGISREEVESALKQLHLMAEQS
jgi:3-dehydroquinate synthase